MTGIRLLTIAHNHPTLHPGGTEIFAHGLFRALRRRGHEGMFLGCTTRLHRTRKPGTVFQTVGHRADEMLLWTGHFDRFFLSQEDLQGIVVEFSELLQELRPDVVHFHHVLLGGLELLHLVRRVLPQARIILTLHDYYLMCPSDGQLLSADGRRHDPSA
jgi:hypothetical protein